MRVRLDQEDLSLVFLRVSKYHKGSAAAGKSLGVSSRAIRDWRRGKHTIPYDQYLKLLALAKLDQQLLTPQLLSDWHYASTAGQKGAQSRQLLYGPLGDAASRKKGGESSYKARRHDSTDIYSRKAITRPGLNVALAEFMGVMIGDGCITKYQVSVALSSLVDREYAARIIFLFNSLFSIQPNTAKRKSSNCTTITASSIELSEYLNSLELPVGNKVKQNHTIPSWIRNDTELEKACLRGIFDTDGCIFQEKHVINDKLYCYSRMSFVSASESLRESIYDILILLGFTPKMRNNRSVNLEKKQDIDEYFRRIGSSNPKHLQRFNNFGGVG